MGQGCPGEGDRRGGLGRLRLRAGDEAQSANSQVEGTRRASGRVRGSLRRERPRRAAERGARADVRWGPRQSRRVELPARPFAREREHAGAGGPAARKAASRSQCQREVPRCPRFGGIAKTSRCDVPRSACASGIARGSGRPRMLAASDRPAIASTAAEPGDLRVLAACKRASAERLQREPKRIRSSARKATGRSLPWPLRHSTGNAQAKAPSSPRRWVAKRRKLRTCSLARIPPCL